MDLLFLLYIFTLVPLCWSSQKKIQKMYGRPRSLDPCTSVCADLPKNDIQPICMMFSRYKKYYQFFTNECHARRAICKENLLLHMVHMSKCFNGNQYFMPVN